MVVTEPFTKPWCQSGLNVMDNPHYEGGHQRPIVVNVQEVDLQDEFMVP